MNTIVTPERRGSEPLALPVLHSIRRSRSGRKLAFALLIALMGLPLALLFVPWLQSVPGSGRVVAFDPAERIRTIPAPITGRLTELRVQDGSRVRKGDLLARMEDQDPDFFLRLQQQLELDRFAVDAAKAARKAIEEQLDAIRDEQIAAIKQVDREIDAAVKKVLEAEKKVESAIARRGQKELDLDRKRDGRSLEVTAQRDLEIAQRDFDTAVADLAAAEAAEQRFEQEMEAKRASREKINKNFEAKMNEATAKGNDADVKVQEAEKKLRESASRVERQRTQEVFAPADGTILSIGGASRTELISKSAPLIEFMPDSDDLAVEMWMRGIDAPLVSPGRKARVVFEGWPAVPVAGWPSVAVGTFGGVVRVVDAQAGADGRVRVLISPDPDGEPWPETPFLRQGGRATGWVQLETVSAGYEIWRQLNAFPPTIRGGPPATGGAAREAVGARPVSGARP